MLPRLVVASQKSDPFWVLHFQTKKQLKCLNRVIATINKIPNEYVASLVDLTAWIITNLPVLNNSRRSKNWPWISPHTVTGAATGWTFDSSNKIYFAFSHTSRRSLSWRHFASLRSAKNESMFIYFQISSNLNLNNIGKFQLKYSYFLNSQK